MYNDLYGLFTIRWSGGTGKRNCWVVFYVLDWGATELQIEQLIPSNSLVTYVFYILGGRVSIENCDPNQKVLTQWVSTSKRRFFSTSGAYESGSLQRILKEVLESPKAWLEENPKWGHLCRKRGRKHVGTAWENGGKILENMGTYGFHMINLREHIGKSTEKPWFFYLKYGSFP